MEFIKLHGKSKTTHASVSDEDVAHVKAHQWSMSGKYAVTTLKGKHVSMQDYIMGSPPDGFVWDHINNNRTDNQRENLRLATATQNAQNSVKKSNTKSKYKGVTPLKNGKFRARIVVNGQTLSLGVWITELEAAQAYDKAAVSAFGQFALLNFNTKRNLVWNSKMLEP